MVQITIDTKRCKRCGYCVAFCPQKVYTTAENGLPQIQKAEACTGCQLCVKRCPDFALKVEE